MNRLEGVYREVIEKSEKTADNLRHGPRIELLFVARDVPHSDGQGQGCSVIGTGELQTTWPDRRARESALPTGTRRFGGQSHRPANSPSLTIRHEQKAHSH